MNYLTDFVGCFSLHLCKVYAVQLVTQHAKQIILYDLETKTIKGVERMKFLNMNYLIDSVWFFSLDPCKIMQLVKSIS